MKAIKKIEFKFLSQFSQYSFCFTNLSSKKFFNYIYRILKKSLKIRM